MSMPLGVSGTKSTARARSSTRFATPSGSEGTSNRSGVSCLVSAPAHLHQIHAVTVSDTTELVEVQPPRRNPSTRDETRETRKRETDSHHSGWQSQSCSQSSHLVLGQGFPLFSGLPYAAQDQVLEHLNILWIKD